MTQFKMDGMFEEVSYEDIAPPDWRATHTLKPDLRLVSDSALEYGWLTPLIVTQNGTIIDGFHRWWLSHKYRPIERKYKGILPIRRIEVDEIDARILHVQLNRGRGNLVPKMLSELMLDVLDSGKYEEEELKKKLRMGIDEFELLLTENLLKAKKIAEYEYSLAWIPVDGVTGEKIETERPPNPDR